MTTHTLLLLLLLLLQRAPSAIAHAPGEEFTYLSMFLHPDARSGGKLDYETLAKQYLKKEKISERRGRRNLAAIDEAILGLEGGETNAAPAPLPQQPVSAVHDETPRAHAENMTQLALALVHVVKQNKAHSMVDVPCRAHAHWMPAALRLIRERDPTFRYYCVDTNRNVVRRMQQRMAMDGAQFVVSQFWKHDLPRADLVFSWAGLDQMHEQNVVQFVRMLARAGDRHSLVLIGSRAARQDGLNGTDGRGIDLTSWPFSLRQPWSVISGLSTDGSGKQLHVYRPRDMLAMG